MITRRRFIQFVPVTGAVLLAACSDKPTPPAAPAAARPPEPAAAPAPSAAAPAAPAMPAAAGPLVDEKDPVAVALGYVSESTKADKAKYPKHEASQACANCALYQGAAGSASGPCPLFAGKQVNAKGWCGSWVKKPG